MNTHRLYCLRAASGLCDLPGRCSGNGEERLYLGIEFHAGFQIDRTSRLGDDVV